MSDIVTDRFGAVCDAVTAAFFLLVWCFPLALGPDSLRVAFMLIVAELILFHAFAMLSAFSSMGSASGLMWIVGALTYAGAFLMVSSAFQSWWPMLAFGLLLASKLTLGLRSDHDAIWERHFRNGLWMLSFVVLFPLLFGLMIVPLPKLGLQPEVLAQIQGGSGGGSDFLDTENHMAFGIAWFSILAWARWTGFNLLDRNSRNSGDA